jgi:hypothetical protein
MKIISLIFIRFSYVSLIRNSVTGPLVGSYQILYLLHFCIDCTENGKTGSDVVKRKIQRHSYHDRFSA